MSKMMVTEKMVNVVVLVKGDEHVRFEATKGLDWVHCNNSLGHSWDVDLECSKDSIRRLKADGWKLAKAS